MIERIDISVEEKWREALSSNLLSRSVLENLMDTGVYPDLNQKTEEIVEQSALINNALNASDDLMRTSWGKKVLEYLFMDRRSVGVDAWKACIGEMDVLLADWRRQMSGGIEYFLHQIPFGLIKENVAIHLMQKALKGERVGIVEVLLEKKLVSNEIGHLGLSWFLFSPSIINTKTLLKMGVNPLADVDPPMNQKDTKWSVIDGLIATEEVKFKNLEKSEILKILIIDALKQIEPTKHREMLERWFFALLKNVAADELESLKMIGKLLPLDFFETFRSELGLSVSQAICYNQHATGEVFEVLGRSCMKESLKYGDNGLQNFIYRLVSGGRPGKLDKSLELMALNAIQNEVTLKKVIDAAMDIWQKDTSRKRLPMAWLLSFKMLNVGRSDIESKVSNIKEFESASEMNVVIDKLMVSLNEIDAKTSLSEQMNIMKMAAVEQNGVFAIRGFACPWSGSKNDVLDVDVRSIREIVNMQKYIDKDAVYDGIKLREFTSEMYTNVCEKYMKKMTIIGLSEMLVMFAESPMFYAEELINRGCVELERKKLIELSNMSLNSKKLEAL